MMVPVGKSAMGMKGNWMSGGWSLTHADHSSLDIGFSDFLIILDTPYIEQQDAVETFVAEKYGGMPNCGYYISYINEKPSLSLYDGTGAAVTCMAGVPLDRGRNILLFFADRDGNAYIYDNGVLVGTADITVANKNQNNAGALNMMYGSGIDYRVQPMLGFQLYNFLAGGLPDATDRAQIVAEASANPYEIPATLQSRTNYTVEQRISLDFSNIDPAATVVTDNSAYSNDMSISGGSAWAAVGKEMKAPTRVLTPDGGPTYGMKEGYVDQAGLTGLQIGADSLIVEVFIRNLVQCEEFTKRVGDYFPLYLTIGDDIVGTDYVYIMGMAGPTLRIAAGAGGAAILGGGLDFDILGMFQGALHLFCVLGADRYVVCGNGHLFHAGNLAAHNLANVGRLRFFAHAAVGGIANPGTGCILRQYIVPAASTPTDADLLDIHRQYISYPYETPAPLLPYEAFRFTGRMLDGSQIPPASTVIHNCAPGSAGFGESLAIQGGLTWGDIRSAVHV